MFRLVASFQECCQKALNSRERFFKVTNVLVIERSVDWRLPIQFVFCFHRDQFLPITKTFPSTMILLIINVYSSRKLFMHMLCDNSIMTHGSLELSVEVKEQKYGNCYSGWMSEGTKLLRVPFADNKFLIL